MTEAVEFNTPEDAGRFVRERRLSLHLTQAQLATKAGVSRKFVAALESGHPRAELGKTMQVLTAVGLRVRGTLPARKPHYRVVDLKSHVRKTLDLRPRL
ncbi:helix-turn-helix domain-containing protein [Pseudarthrobacter oxydans]|uniref:helix-turn-helix domain-containing protein n=1 Tax=Pseudarthrobacter oxydans TaxID=1671 RepID=UPI0035E90045|nr:hypothetical protein GCM10017547_32170 [Pseudarthrobacter oxydans]